jgi:thiamine-monophosphate kinase
MGFSESDVISMLKKVFASDNPGVILGIGDDAAVIATQPHSVITSDMATEDVHFKVEWNSAFDIGRKITAANVADVLSMGGKCQYLTASVALTGDESMQWIENLARGMKAEADKAGAVIVGGDLTRGAKIVISMTALGNAPRAISRSGASVGEGIYVSSLPGWSAAGLELLIRQISINSEVAERALNQFSAPTLDYEIDFTSATSMADISDSLLVQSEQMANASGVEFAFDESLISNAPEFAELAALASELDFDVFTWIFAGGEDHVLLATGSDLPGIRIGTVRDGSGITGVNAKVAPVSWSHF